MGKQFRDRWAEAHPSHQIIAHLERIAPALKPFRFYEEYVNYLEWDRDLGSHEGSLLILIETWDSGFFEELSAKLAGEEKGVRSALLRQKEPPRMPYHDDVARAVRRLGGMISSQQLIWEIHEYALRGGWDGCSRVGYYVRQQNWDALGAKIFIDMGQLDKVFPNPANREVVQRAIERVCDTYFEICEVRPDGTMTIRPKFGAATMEER